MEIVKKSTLYTISAFVSGAAVMAIEMSATRLLAPYFGNSLYVWTNVIGLIMMALAAGYYCGGRLADQKPKASIYFSLIFLTGAWALVIPFVSGPFFAIITRSFSNLAEVVRIGSFVAVAFLFVFPLFLLGMIVPFTVKMVLVHVEEAGTVSGKISMISTLGSLVGTFLPAFVLIPVLGTTKTFVCIGIVLMLLAAFGLRKWIFVIIALASIGFFWLVPPVFAHDSIIYAKDSPYGFVFVTEDEEGVRRLHVNNPIGTQSLYDPASPLAPEPYYYSYFGVLPAMVETPQTVLILGHGGGSFTRIFNAYYPELSVTGVEIDPTMTEAAELTMGLLDATVEIVYADARTYLLNTEKNYDLILVDTYQTSSIPAHLATHEFFELVHSRLNEGGLVALNASSASGDFLNSLVKSVDIHFDQMAAYAVPNSTNSMILGSDDLNFDFLRAVPEMLSEKAAAVTEGLYEFSFSDEVEVFTDEKATRVEILSDAMHMQVLQGF